MPRFFRRLAEGVFDTEDLKRRTHELADFVVARRQYGLPEEIIGVGYSNGANIAASLMPLRPGTLRGAVLFRPMVPFVPDTLPKLERTEVLLAAGRQDQIVPAGETVQLRQMFELAGASVSLHWHNGGHELGQDDIDATRRWLEGVD